MTAALRCHHKGQLHGSSGAQQQQPAVSYIVKILACNVPALVLRGNSFSSEPAACDGGIGVVLHVHCNWCSAHAEMHLQPATAHHQQPGTTITTTISLRGGRLHAPCTLVQMPGSPGASPLLQFAVSVPPSEHAASTTVQLSFSLFLLHAAIQACGRKLDLPSVVTFPGAPVQFAGGSASHWLVTFVQIGTSVALVADAG
jgi:hypothetical protein